MEEGCRSDTGQRDQAWRRGAGETLDRETKSGGGMQERCWTERGGLEEGCRRNTGWRDKAWRRGAGEMPDRETRPGGGVQEKHQTEKDESQERQPDIYRVPEEQQGTLLLRPLHTAQTVVGGKRLGHWATTSP